MSRTVYPALLACALAAACDDAVDAAALEDEATLAAAERSGARLQTRQPVLCNGDPATLTGVVASVGSPGEGLTITTAEGPVTVYGLGPIWYWNQSGVARPVVGDAVEAVITDLTTGAEDVLLRITINGVTFELRDRTTCVPLWRGAGCRG